MNLGIESSPSATVVGLIETDALYGQFPYPVVQSGTNKKTTVTAARGGHDFPRPAPDIGNRAWLAAVLLVLLAGGYHRLFRPGTKIAQAELPRKSRGFGRVTGDAKTKAQGQMKQAEGSIQDLYGQAVDAAEDTIDAVRKMPASPR